MTYTQVGYNTEDKIEYEAQLAYFRTLLKGSRNIDKPSIEKIMMESPFKLKIHFVRFLKMRNELFDSFKFDGGE
tara:strand:+ start:329 stop:550 length:222 start_codon:yes stop_codon:yes gene_type:complete